MTVLLILGFIRNSYYKAVVLSLFILFKILVLVSRRKKEEEKEEEKKNRIFN